MKSKKIELSKSVEKRFDEWVEIKREGFKRNAHVKLKDIVETPELKQHLASELSRATKKARLKGYINAYDNLKSTGVLKKALSKQKKELVKEIKTKKFPRGQRQWCIQCANRICRFIEGKKIKKI